MSVGDYLAGEELAGDSIPSVTPSANRTRPLALRFDPTTRAHVYDATTGRFAELHPIDAWVVNTMFITLGKMSGAPNVGTEWQRIYSPWAKDAAAIASDVVRTAMAPKVRDGSISIRGIRFDRRTYATFVELSYTNNRLDSNKVVDRLFPIG